ncbi:MAG: hypothetical protein KatS3mg056_2782 [Chloroflexus sp.]|nr:MAG: hypothetical protein KatS3mg056_2782 [Chloroflexus sp.]
MRQLRVNVFAIGSSTYNAELLCYLTITQAQARLPINNNNLPLLARWQSTTPVVPSTHCIDCLAGSSCACREVWSAAAMLPQAAVLTTQCVAYR